MRAYNFGARRSNLTKLFHVTCPKSGMTIWVQQFGAPSAPLKFGRAKSVQNSAPFWTTSDFDREYLQNGWTYRKLKKASDQLRSLPRTTKNGEVWSTNKKVINAQFDQPKVKFIGRLYLGP